MSANTWDGMKQVRSCRFRISDVADLLRLSVSGVIYLEKKGAIQAQREANGYRYYGEDVITQLGTIRSFERMGFSLKEAVSLLDKGTEETLAALKEKKQTLMSQIQWIDLLFDRMENAWQKADGLGESAIEMAVSPAFYFFPYWEKYCDVEHMTRQEQRALRKVDVSWLSGIPAVNYCGKIIISDQGVVWQKGTAVTVDDAERYGLALHPMVERYQPRHCLHLFSQDGPEQLWESIQAVGRKAHLTLGSPILAIIHHMENSKFPTKNFLVEVWAPVEGNG